MGLPHLCPWRQEPRGLRLGKGVLFRGVSTNAHPARPKGPHVRRSLPPGGMANFLLTWLQHVPRPWCRLLGGGSHLLSGLGTWPGKVRPCTQQTEGETSAVWSLGLPEFSGSFSLETWGGGGKQVSSGEPCGTAQHPCCPETCSLILPMGDRELLSGPF